MSSEQVDALVIYGATGDLAKLETFPALLGLVERGELNVPVLGVAMSGWDLAKFREYAADSLRHNGMDADSPAAVKMLGLLQYVDGDLGDSNTYAAIAESLGPGFNTGAKQILHYLEVPPFLFARITEGISSVGLAAGSRIMVEKPFGDDEASARELNDTVHKHFIEESVYRVDHWLALDPVASLMFVRFTNSIVEPLLNRNHVEAIQITLAETLDVADRGHFYDQTGAIKDVVQNHMLQVLATVLADPPDGTGLDSWIASKSQLIGALQPLRPENVIKGQYEGYQLVDGVAAGSTVETYAAVRLEADTWRWAGVPILLRTGKCLPTDATDVMIYFKQVPHDVFALGKDATTTQNSVRFRIYPDSQAALHLVGKRPGTGWTPEVQDLTFVQDRQHAEMRAYDRLIGAALMGERWLFAHQDQVEACWRIVDPVVGDIGPVIPYPRGSWGPDSSPLLPPGESWHNPTA